MLTRAIDKICRREGGKVLARLIRRFGDIGLAEDLLHEAYAKALATWAASGLPDNPAAWLTTVPRNHGLDIVRRNAKLLPDCADVLEALEAEPAMHDDQPGIEDDRLRLIFVCYHPALNGKAQAMLALRTLCGLSTREIARAYIESEDAAAQRVVRAKRKNSSAKIPFDIPAPEQLAERLALVLQVVYLMFNEGYGATSGASLLRPELGAEALRLASILRELMPAQADWRQIAQLYRALLRYWPTPVVELNAAVAVGMADGYEHGLRLIDAVEARGEVARSHYLYAARAGRLRRLERNAEAAAAFDQALSLVADEVERDYLKQQREALPLTATAPSRRRQDALPPPSQPRFCCRLRPTPVPCRRRQRQGLPRWRKCLRQPGLRPPGRSLPCV